ncbi:MAG: PilZ domain-containing protein, partial [Myxococcales bacterium]
MHEDRKLPRLTRPLELTLEDGWRAEVEDLSATGLRIRTLAVLPRGAELELAIPIDGAGLEAVRAR